MFRSRDPRGPVAAPQVPPRGAAGTPPPLWRRPCSPAGAAVALAAWLTVAGNLSLWAKLVDAIASPAQRVVTMGAVALVVFAVHAALLAACALLLPGRWVKPAWMAVAVVAALAQHYTLRFGVVVDPQLIASATQTNLGEALDVLDLWLPLNVAWLAGPPIAWLAVVPFRPEPWVRRAAWASAVAVLGLLVGAGVTAASYRTLAPLVRNNMELRFLPNPVMPLVSAGRLVRKALQRERAPVAVTLGEGAALGASYGAAHAKPPLLILVVGETARADHFGLNGYARDTTPELAAHGVVSYPNAHSCGTHTLASVPCMFSPLGEKAFDRNAPSAGNLLDVVSAAGLAVLWVDNQAGCKGVCDRVPHASTEDIAGTEAGRRLCADGECLDEALLVGLEQRIAALDPQRRRHGVLLVLHQMGSHGPAYGRRSPPERKPFQPECATLALADCDRQALVNAYDNSIAYTDHVLAALIDRFGSAEAGYAPMLFYVSDHGESLGEHGVFLHGLPKVIAPAAQTHVPMIAWFDASALARGDLDIACIRSGRDAAVGHDHLFHTVLGALDISSPSYRRDRDLWAPCRGRQRPGETARSASRE